MPQAFSRPACTVDCTTHIVPVCASSGRRTTAAAVPCLCCALLTSQEPPQPWAGITLLLLVQLQELLSESVATISLEAKPNVWDLYNTTASFTPGWAHAPPVLCG